MHRWLVLLFLLNSCGPASKIPEYKSAEVQLLDSTHEKKFALLPTNGGSSKSFWSSSPWNTEMALINWRWNSPQSETMDYASPFQIQIFLMTQEELAALSPAEKYDLWKGRYEFPLKEEAYSHLDKNFDPVYAWQVASLFHEESSVKVMVNADGLSIPFGSSDIKGLLSYHYSLNPPERGDSIGKICEVNGCLGDLDAGTFHITLANKLGAKGEVFFIDVNSKDEVEGRLAIKYNSVVVDELNPSDQSPNGTTRILKIMNRITFLESSPLPNWDPVGASYAVKEYSYYLYLNLKNEIIGGKWLSWDRPDSLWVVKKGEGFTDLLEGLEEIMVN